MYWLLLIGSLTIVLFIVAWLIDNYSYDGLLTFCFSTAGAICLIILLILSLSLINRNARFEAFIADYENTVALVETYEGNDYGNMNDLTKKIIEMNCDIAQHKELSKSKWTNLWYSEKIGQLKPIRYKR